MKTAVLGLLIPFLGTAAVPSVTFGDISPHRGESPSERSDDVCEVGRSGVSER